MGKPFFLPVGNSGGNLDIDIHAYKQIRVIVSVNHETAKVQLSLYEGGSRIGDLDQVLYPVGPLVPNPNFNPGPADPDAPWGNITRVYNTPGRTLRVRVTAPGYFDYGPDLNPGGGVAPHLLPQRVTVVIYGTPS